MQLVNKVVKPNLETDTAAHLKYKEDASKHALTSLARVVHGLEPEGKLAMSKQLPLKDLLELAVASSRFPELVAKVDQVVSTFAEDTPGVAKM